MKKNIIKPRIGGAVYILPNLFTTGNLFFGFFSIVKSLSATEILDYWIAAVAILLAAIFDVLDGRVARMTKATSEFGVQYDSLCDLISFGAAPAFLMYQYGLNEFGRIGWIVCFLYLACGALRLARFNVASSIGKASGDFTGLPIPMAAGVIATFCALMADLHGGVTNDFWIIRFIRDNTVSASMQNNFLLVAGPFLALAMVSNFVYRSHKTIKVAGVTSFRLLALFVFGISLLAVHPELFGFCFAFGYAISGPFEWMVGWKKIHEDHEIFAPPESDEIMDQAHRPEANIEGGNPPDHERRIAERRQQNVRPLDRNKGEP